MAERVTKVTLTAAVDGYVTGMNRAAKATSEAAKGAEKLARQNDAFQALGKGAVAFGALAAVGVGVAVKKFADFDKQMSAVQASTHETTVNMQALRDAALQAGADTAFSATQAAGAVEELGKAGVETKDILSGGLKGSLDLAAAGQLEVADAAEIAASALTQFNLAGSDVPHVADLLAAGAGKAQGSVQDMGAALNQAGLVASQMGLSIEETVGSLAAFASAGLIGSDAGTSFRSALLRLANPTEEAKKAMQDLGISAYDAGGQFVGIESLAGQLQDRLGGLTQAQRDQTLALVFGQDAIRVANLLYKEGAQGIEEWTKKVDDSGYAAETAKARMDNLAGDLEKLGGALDTALIKSGSAANDALRGLVQSAEALVDGFANAPQAVQTTALAVGALATGVGLLGGAALLAVPKIAAFRGALIDLGVSTAQVDAGMGKLKGSIGALAGVAAFAWAAKLSTDFIDAQREAAGLKDTVDSLLDSLDEVGTRGTVDKVAGGLGNLTDGGLFSDILAGAENFLDGAADYNVALKSLGVEGQLTSSRLSTLDKTMAQLVASGETEKAARLYDELASRTNGSKEALSKLDKLLPEYARSQNGASAATEDTSAVVEDFVSTTETAATAVQDFSDALRGLGDTQLSLNDANRAVEESLDAFTKTVEENGQTLDITTEAGRENQAALDAIAQSYKDVAAATVENTGKQEDAIPVIQAGRDAVVAAGVAAGLSQAAAEAYADSLELIPSDVQTQIDLESQAALDAATAFAEKLNSIPNSKEVYLYVQEQRQVLGYQQQGQTINADGGMYNYRAFANGGIAPGIYAGRAGGIHKFAEPETRWEAFISGKPGQEERNRQIWMSAGERLGMMSAGGSTGAASVASAVAGRPVLTDELLREVRDAVRSGFRVPVGAVQGALGSSNVGNSTRGR